MLRYTHTAACLFAVALLAIGLGLPSASALDEERGEEAAIKACDLRLCAILVQKNPAGEDLKCKLSKTWSRSKIKDADSQKLTWGFGDARCSVEINISRELVVSALTADRRKLFIPPHTAHCVVEHDGQLEKVTAVLSPKIAFVNGKADKIWVNLSSVEGPVGIKTTLLAAAQLADGLGLFHKQMLKAVNRHIERHCPSTYPQLVAATPKEPQSKAKPAAKSPAAR